MKNNIEVTVKDHLGCTTDSFEFESQKAAKAWVKNTGLNADYWERASESADFAKDHVCLIELTVNGNCVQDWTPNF